jgi:hypothetical protein
VIAADLILRKPTIVPGVPFGAPGIFFAGLCG